MDPDLAEWRRKLDGRIPSTRVWLRYLRDGEPRQVLTQARDMLWPPEELMRVTGSIPERKLAQLRVRLDRIGRAIWEAPRNLLAIARGGRNVTSSAQATRGSDTNQADRGRQSLRSEQRPGFT